jgi:hypothetical protein
MSTAHETPSLTRRHATFTLTACIALVTGLMFTGPVHAKRGRRVRLSGAGLGAGAKTAGPTLTRDELRACIALQNSINREADVIDLESARMEQEKNRLDNYSALIDIQRIGLDSYNPYAVDAFNGMVRSHRLMVSNYNAKSLHFNQRVLTQNAGVLQFNSTCAGKAYYESDMQAVLSTQPR